MKATAIYSCPSLAPRVAVLFDDGETRLADPETGRYSDGAIDRDFIPARVARGLARDVSETPDGRLLLSRINLAQERRAAAAALGRMGGRTKSAAKSAAATRRAAARRSSPSALVSVVELRRRIFAYVIADEAAHGRGALPSKTRAAMLTDEALGYRRELAAKLAALPADADPREALRELIAGHPHSAKRERWRWLLLRDPTAQP